MTLKDKFKTTVIAVSTTIMTSCGLFGSHKKEALEPNERPATEEAKGNTEQTLFDAVPENGSISLEDAQKIIQQNSGDIVSKQLAKELQQNGISITKRGQNGQDSILYSVQRINEGCYEHPKWVLKNPKYTLNMKSGNSEEIDDINIKRKNNETYKLDSATIGIKEITSEIISQEIVHARELKVRSSTLNNLNEGDTIFVGNIPAVVKEKGKLPVIEDKQLKDTKVETYVFDYVREKTPH